MRTLFLFIAVLFLLSSGARALLPAELERLAQDTQWHRLVYYQPRLLGGWESQIDSPNFFLATEGKYDPRAELAATLTELQSAKAVTAAEAQSTICRFPARRVWLQQKSTELGLGLDLPERPCPRFQKWFETLRGVSASLVFSSYFLNNPSSTFGHTLIRINKAPTKDGSRYELLDYGVNFAANADSANPFIYAVKGLFGGFPGTFTNVPYYYKVREYNNSESRDLWEYELNLSPEVTDQLVRHIWEVGPTYADYWYLTENCSYFMLALIEAAEPKVELSSKLKKFVIPTDTLRVLFDSPGLVKSYHFRPSVRTELFARLQNLSEEEKSILSELIVQRNFSSGLLALPATRRRLVLDAAIDDMDYLFPVGVQKPGTPEWKFKNEILMARSEINEITEVLQVPTPEIEAPHAGHGSRRVGLGFLSNQVNEQESSTASLLSYRFSFHDILDPVRGFPEYAQIIFFDFRFAFENKSKRLELFDLNLFEVLSLSPYSTFSKSLSWRLKVGVERLSNEDCGGCHAGLVTGGAGYALQFSELPKVVSYLGIKAGLFYTPRESREKGFSHWLIGAGPNLTLRSRWSEYSMSSLEFWYRKDSGTAYQEYKELLLSHQFSFGKNDGLRGTVVERWFEHSAALEYFHYY